jgi:hypothetical protein
MVLSKLKQHNQLNPRPSPVATGPRKAAVKPLAMAVVHACATQMVRETQPLVEASPLTCCDWPQEGCCEAAGHGLRCCQLLAVTLVLAPQVPGGTSSSSSSSSGDGSSGSGSSSVAFDSLPVSSSSHEQSGCLAALLLSINAAASCSRAAVCWMLTLLLHKGHQVAYIQHLK